MSSARINDIGMRVSYSFAVRDQNRLVYQDDNAFVASLPAELRPTMQRWYDRLELSWTTTSRCSRTCMASTRPAVGQKSSWRRPICTGVRITALTRLADMSRQYNVPLHMHLLETAYQKEYAHRRGDCSAVEYIDRFGLLGPQMTLGHGVWLTEKDIDRLAETGTCVCHNCSSNFRLRSGVAALNVLEARGRQHRHRHR